MTQPEIDEVRIRRAPKFSAFIVVGAVVGFVVTLIVTARFPADPTVGFGPTLAYFSIYGVTAGILLGCTVAIILDRVSARRARTVTVEREVVPPFEDELETGAPIDPDLS
jgi:hypothetical protein